MTSLDLVSCRFTVEVLHSERCPVVACAWCTVLGGGGEVGHIQLMDPCQSPGVADKYYSGDSPWIEASKGASVYKQKYGGWRAPSQVTR